MVKARLTGVDRVFNNILKKLKAGADLTSNELAILGKRYAQSIAPYDTGRTAQHIAIYTKGNTKQIKAKNPTRGKQHRWAGKSGYKGVDNYPNFNLVRWMHTSPRAKSHFKKGGQPRFMYKTRDYLNSIKKGVAKGRFKNINLR